MRYVYPHKNLKTHAVKNQARDLAPLPLWEADPALQEAFNHWATDQGERVQQFARQVGSEESIEWGWQANQNKPKLITHDRFGHRVDEVEYHPAYHQLMKLGVNQETSSVAWATQEEGKLHPHGHLLHAAQLYLLSQVEPGVCCPLSMTYAAASVLSNAPHLDEQFKKLTTPDYDGRSLPINQKHGITMGMAMTEKQGGSDVRANETTARALPSEGDHVYSLEGHKWFCSAPMSDAFLTLGRVDDALTCFFLPRWWGDEQRNDFKLIRLKDKLGNHANASSEIEFHGARAYRVGDVGAGIRTIIEMVHHTRLDASLANASLMRQATTQAIAHCTHRAAFGGVLIKQPLMRMVLADLWLESEAATWTTLFLANAFDLARREGGEQAKLFTRLATAVVKYWVCKRTPAHVYEALECHGGAGYVEESVMPRLYREAPLNSIWEGSGNVMCLDILRAIQRSPDTLKAYLSELERGRGHHPALDSHLDHLSDQLTVLREWSPSQAAAQSRGLGADLALALQGSILARYAPNDLSEAFCEARLGGSPQRVYGDLSTRVAVDRVLSRADGLLDVVGRQL